jgi:hypothetical protein
VVGAAASVGTGAGIVGTLVGDTVVSLTVGTAVTGTAVGSRVSGDTDVADNVTPTVGAWVGALGGLL